jgi:hypothetical protein
VWIEIGVKILSLETTDEESPPGVSRTGFLSVHLRRLEKKKIRKMKREGFRWDTKNKNTVQTVKLALSISDLSPIIYQVLS